MSIIEVSNLTTNYGESIIHDNISFSVEKGEIFSILGGSGSGKTTLLHTLIFLHKPKSGTIKILDSNIWSLRDSKKYVVMRKMGVVFQFGALFSSLNVLQNVTSLMEEYSHFPPNLYPEIAKFWLHNVGLDLSVCEKSVNELSGGMKKRVALARALCSEPSILFLDEPTSGLDPASACKFDDLILSLKENFGVTIVMITHDLDSIKDVTDRFILLQNKKIEFNGTLKQFGIEAREGLHKGTLFDSTRGRKYWEGNY
ncbi:ATP-binding cassette domain-containing protein [Helicobacter saguini]|uniref:ATP-binding cassette domain-containing protein n=1 Tax=Helicobacter saguini TaxID=1548018 RepID=A0A347VS37_9HELI|nr:ATP-binding cassette domain-containing protein [Helicobacter saguini]MWV62666.1 ATP-binding cassette domain-containing protein [Helicobacter saguini]MWV66662.1 ATP-binding cassette domain-containing protein [Helicobacter saguini]MWV69012.1 ATP-binding cassette domain-containing protein [Helicobacter saguini]MWV71434.1 ATP-binding cassette domain-containing protein [Helicobacter saguini]TLD94084.1 ATP-binding cassette domain-containing protein [Helicobacter saguini]